MELSNVESALLTTIGAGFTSLVGLIVWVVRSVVPRILSTLEDRTKALVTAVERIPDALDKFEDRLAASEAKILAKIEEKRFDDLKEELRRRLPADDTIPPMSNKRGG
ncbi:hypothetical protein WMF27_20455 [Sorangium sp. So ce281]|uniref:hypothetical protein n=1 Tax=unclassified Sorangium TaxID=2621164 RepID=UPI003F6240FA